MFISEAYAQAASGAAAQPGGLESMFSSFGVMILIFAVFWFLLIRPQQKRQKEIKNFRDSLTSGSEIVTAGGIYGKIKEVSETYFIVEIAKGVTVRVDKGSVYPSAGDANQAAQNGGDQK